MAGIMQSGSYQTSWNLSVRPVRVNGCKNYVNVKVRRRWNDDNVVSINMIKTWGKILKKNVFLYLNMKKDKQ